MYRTIRLELNNEKYKGLSCIVMQQYNYYYAVLLLLIRKITFNFDTYP